MDSDPESYFTSSNLFKTSLLTISFSVVYFYRTENNLPFFKKPVIMEDTVSVTATPVKQVVKKKKRTIYLTFDDGPNRGTEKVMDIINAEQIPASMFIIGEHVYGSKEQTAIYDSLLNNRLFELANHSYTHAFHNNYQRYYSNPDSVVSDFTRCRDSLHLNSNIVRTPGRNTWRTETVNSTDLRNTIAAADSLYSNGYKAIGWDLEWHFTNDQHIVQSDSMLVKQVDSVFIHNRTKTPGQLVLLAHDRAFYSSADSASLHRFIIRMKETDEYDFETVSKYPGATGN